MIASATRYMGKSAARQTEYEPHRSLVLMGEFQNGKSTLFNYLCDGRELSRMGGGSRTSGCRLAAHALLSNDREKEHAIVHWRSHDDLCRLIQSVLPSSVKVTSLSAAEPIIRRILLEQPTDSGDHHELVQFAYLVSHFYPRFKQHIRETVTRCALQRAKDFASYPQNWELLWQKVREFDGSLSRIFDEDMAAFVFCRSVDFYLHSPMLRALGCSVVDSPGFNASAWDATIANDCAQEASAILYIFRGDKVPTVDELERLKKLPQEKIIFAANLYTSRKKWKRLMQYNLRPRLAEPGWDFAHPEVHEFHAAMALRACELRLLKQGSLSNISLSAIESCKPKEYSVEEFLEGVLSHYAKTLGGAFDIPTSCDPVFLEREECGVFRMLPILKNYVQHSDNAKGGCPRVI